MSTAPLHSQCLSVVIITDVSSNLCQSVPVKEHSQHTIGVEFSSRTVKLGEKRIKLQVGQPSLLRVIY